MDDRNAQVGWTEAQWNRVREEVLEAWQRVRVAGSFLPIYGPLPPSTTVVPSEVLKHDGSVDDRATADLLEIALPVTLSRQQILEEDLSSALLQFRRRATQLGQLEDWYIFNGTYPSIELTAEWLQMSLQQERRPGFRHYRPDLAYLDTWTSSRTGPYKWHPEADRGRGPDPADRGHASAESRVVGVDRGSKGGAAAGEVRASGGARGKRYKPGAALKARGNLRKPGGYGTRSRRL